jgi:hypothetical protein
MYSPGHGCFLHVSAGDFYQVFNEKYSLYLKGTNSVYSQGQREYHNVTNGRVLGLCTGAFAAAAVSCSHNTVDLVPLAVKAVIAAFRTGIIVTEAAKRVAPWSDENQSWSLLVPGSASSEAVEKFREETVNAPFLTVKGGTS